MAHCTTSHQGNEPTSCSFCNAIINDWIICTRCNFRYCRQCANTQLPGPVLCTCCPSCANGQRAVCPDVYIKPSSRFPVAVLLIYVEQYLEPTHHLMNTVVGALKCGGVKVSIYQMTTVAALENDPDYYLWLTELPVECTLFVFLVTETVLNGGWVLTDGEDRGWCPEIKVLSALFDGDPVWRDAYCRLRESYLFILTCGGNFSPERDEPDLPGKMSNWLSDTQIFGHAVAILNPRLIISEVLGFYALLVKELCVHHTSFQEALIQAYCREEHIQAHTDLLWLTGGFPALVLRNASGARICGLNLPYLCLPTCQAHSDQRRVKRGRGNIHQRGFEHLTTCCCKAVYHLKVDQATKLPEEHVVGSRRYVLENWPGGFKYTLSPVTQPTLTSN